MSKIMQEIEKLALERTAQLKKAKKEGRKVVQYTSNFIPEEFIRAAGAEPYLMCRGGEPEPTEIVLDEMLRFMNPLARAMAGNYRMGIDPVTPISDLIIAHQSECHISRITELLESWGLPIAKVGVPAAWNRPTAFEYYVNSLKAVIAQLEELTGNKIDEAVVRQYMKDTNAVNAGLRKIDSLRKKANPPIGGVDFIRLNHWSYMVEPKLMAQKLDELYEELKDAPGIFEEGAPRILLFGHAVAHGDYTVPKTLENMGAVIVTDFMDEGMRAYKWDIDTESDDLVRAFARARYLDKPPVNIMQPGWKERFAHTKALVEEYNVDAVVSYQLVFDEIYNMEFMCLSKWLGEMDKPVIKIESSYEYSREAMGQLTTRIESFIDAVKEAM